MTEISIIMASFHGARSLPRCFAALRAQQSTGAAIEYIFVDNASTDETAALMQEFTETMGGATLHEPRKGKTFALNTALKHVQGDLIIFIDDDILPDEAWLQAYLDAAATQPEAALFAGALRPDWPARPSEWQLSLADSGRSFGCTPVGKPAGACAPQTVKGGNFAVRRSAIGDISFDEGASNLGDRPGAAGGQDTRFASEIARNGGEITYVPSASAKHIVKSHETSIGAIITRYRRIGRGSAAQRNTLAVWLTAPFMLIAFSILAIFAAIVGQRAFAATQMTRAASRFGRLEFVASRLWP
jgi:glycosyltransferase involved in cell wall biosynthesis